MSKDASKKPKIKGMPIVRDGKYRLKKRSKTRKEKFLEFILYKAKKSLAFAISKKAKRIPKEQQDEMYQEAYLKILELFDKKLIKKKKWPTYIRVICFGTVLDYKKLGKGFEDSPGWLRFENMSSEDNEISIDQVLSFNGKVTIVDPHKIEINWDLACRLASRDKWLECFLRQIRSEKLREIAPVMGVSVSRTDQYINEFIDRFDDPKDAENPWVQQTAYALGIAELLGWPNRPLQLEGGAILGAALEPINLDKEPEHENVKLKDAQSGFEKNQLGEFKIPPRLKEMRAQIKTVCKPEETEEPVHNQQAFGFH